VNLEARTPLTLITGPLGSGKTTLLRYILATVPSKIAILMNEFGELAIDSRIIQGKNIQLAELEGGCVCCSLLGEFEAAVNEIIDTAQPDLILVETTGLAEPEALVFDTEEALPQVRLDGVVTIMDADAMTRYPQLGHTTRMQIEAADIILLNKADLVSAQALDQAKVQISRINENAPILPTRQCKVDPELLFGIGRDRMAAPPRHVHQPEFGSFSYTTEQLLDRLCFERMIEDLDDSVYRAKGFVRFCEASCLFNFVVGRLTLEPFEVEKTELVFIGKELERQKDAILAALQQCEEST
jgi:G3E family GTPase